MFKTKLLILLLINLIFISSCTTNRLDSGMTYSVGYIDGEYTGFVFKNKLLIHLNNYNLYNKISNYQIRADVNHATNTYVTNINNTSDRSNIETIMNIEMQLEAGAEIVYIFDTASAL